LGWILLTLYVQLQLNSWYIGTKLIR